MLLNKNFRVVGAVTERPHQRVFDDGRTITQLTIQTSPMLIRGGELTEPQTCIIVWTKNHGIIDMDITLGTEVTVCGRLTEDWHLVQGLCQYRYKLHECRVRVHPNLEMAEYFIKQEQ